MPKKKVLIITYYWPPSGGVGVQRWLHFAKNLKSTDWEPVIYTPENPQFEIKDENLTTVAEGLEVVTMPIWEPFSIFHKITGNKEKSNVQQGLVLEKSKKSWKDKIIIWIRGNVFIPDPRVFWVKRSVTFLMDFLKKEKIDTIVTTGPPHSMHLIGLGLTRVMPRIKWLADFRDPWSDWDILEKLNTGSSAMKRHQHYERQVLTRANVVTTVSKRLAEALSTKTNPTRQVEVLSNGIADDKGAHFHMEPPTSEKFVIGYYGMLNELRDPEQLWSLLEEICKQNNDFSEKLEIRLGGIVSQSIRERLEHSPQLENKVVFLGYVPHEQVFEEYRRCSVLLLLLNKSDNAKWILPVKFFEYLSAGRSILGIGPVDSDLGDIFKGHRIGDIYESEAQEDIRKFILANFGGQYFLEAEDYRELLQQYSRTHQASELANLLDKL